MYGGHQLSEHGAPVSAGSNPYWYAIQTRSRHEKFVDSQLRQQGIITFLPLASELRCWSDRRKLVQLPLFPGYLFVRVVASREARAQILRASGVVSMVGTRGEPISIPDSQIESIQKLVSNNVPFVHHPFLRVGQRVRIRGGCLDGIEGILVGHNGNRSLIVSVETIRRSLAIRVEGCQIESIET